ncbi:MAG TPA: hypothetical protein VFJ58_00840 [Armatimonadota bacterium]|nr:hypothetical protein [Armatimonadota bacterium]
MANSVEAALKTILEMKTDDIRKSAMMALKVALVGSEDEIVWLQEHFRGRTSAPGDLRRLADTLKLFEAPPDSETLKKINECAFACVTPGAAASIAERGMSIIIPIYTIGNEGEWVHFTREILDTRWDLHLALGRNLPGLRPDVVEYLIVNVACINTEVAVASAVFAKIPGIGPIYPGVALGDTIILTKNQIYLAFRLAGACGLAIDLVHRRFDVVSIIGGGFLWRTLARESAGLVPTPVGVALKGAIAYAGTYVVGKAVFQYFDTGSRMDRSTERKLYRTALESGKEVARGALGRIVRRPRPFRRKSHQAPASDQRTPPDAPSK